MRTFSFFRKLTSISYKYTFLHSPTYCVHATVRSPFFTESDDAAHIFGDALSNEQPSLKIDECFIPFIIHSPDRSRSDNLAIFILFKRPCIMSQRGITIHNCPRGKTHSKYVKSCNEIGVEIWAEAGTDLRKFVSDSTRVQRKKLYCHFYT